MQSCRWHRDQLVHQHYFGGRELREWQFYWHHAAQTQPSCVGDQPDGKTVGAGLRAMRHSAAMTPGYEYMNVAPTAWQSALSTGLILAEAADKPFEKFIYKVRRAALSPDHFEAQRHR
ncbi:MAG: hypothetical protein HS126_21840 [Anaerolineales bacterium]|nr:hypothetical protein [Anaerolineales bacterium]